MNSPQFTLEIDAQRCTGCGRCVAACRQRLFTLESRGHRKCAVLLSLEPCTKCWECIRACPVRVIEFRGR